MDCKFNDKAKEFFWNPRVKELFERQKDKGINKYGKTLEQHDAEKDHSVGHVINHLEEELADACVYGRWLLSKLKGGTPERAKKVIALSKILWQIHDALDGLDKEFSEEDYERE